MDATYHLCLKMLQEWIVKRKTILNDIPQKNYVNRGKNYNKARATKKALNPIALLKSGA